MKLSPADIERIKVPSIYSQRHCYDGNWTYFGNNYKQDYEGLSINDWFRANHRLFIMPVEAITAARIPYEWDEGPHGEGIYFLYSGDELVYVGQSVNINSRLQQHGFPVRCGQIKEDWLTHFSCIWVPKDLLDAVENYYLYTILPPRNRKFPHPGKLALEHLPPNWNDLPEGWR